VRRTGPKNDWLTTNPTKKENFNFQESDDRSNGEKAAV